MNHTYKYLFFSVDHKGNLERLAEIETSTLLPFTEMNPTQVILLSNNVSGRVFSPNYTSSLAFCLCTLAMYWDLLMLSSTT